MRLGTLASKAGGIKMTSEYRYIMRFSDVRKLSANDLVRQYEADPDSFMDLYYVEHLGDMPTTLLTTYAWVKRLPPTKPIYVMKGVSRAGNLNGVLL